MKIEILLAVSISLIIINIIVFIKKKFSFDIKPQLEDLEKSVFKFETNLERTEKSIKDEFQRNRTDVNETLKINREELSNSLLSFEKKFSNNIKDIQNAVEQQLKAIREDNSAQLDRMRETVDEKLQNTLEKRLGESFKQVSERLEQVNKGLGEMQTIATGVGDLKKVLSNVKTRGVLGEYQLANILEQILTPEQYSKNVATKKGSQANVEFAIKFPGATDKDVWVPIDSKFPIEDYNVLLDAMEIADKAEIEKARVVLQRKIESFAKDISTKYIDPPNTTDFAIMFLPVESLYAEILRYPGLFEKLQREYKITVAGPTTLSAILNSFQMGFRTLSVQKRSSEVWDILKSAKTEFTKFSGVLEKAQNHINKASDSLTTLRTTRTSAIQRKLSQVETFTAIETKATQKSLEEE